MTGAACGLVNGSVTVRWRLPSFLVTLAMLEMARGGAYLVTHSQTIYLGARVDVISSDLAGRAHGARAARGGRGRRRRVRPAADGLRPQLLAVGTNEESAHLAGISPGRVRLAAFTIAGALAGLAAVVQAGRLAAVDPNAGTGLELEAIAAVVIGGASLTRRARIGGQLRARRADHPGARRRARADGRAGADAAARHRRGDRGLRHPRSLSGTRKDRSMTQPAIVVVGSLNADLVVHVPRFPVAGETISGEGFVVLPGGKGANQACAAGRLGGRGRDDRSGGPRRPGHDAAPVAERGRRRRAARR